MVAANFIAISVAVRFDPEKRIFHRGRLSQ